MARGRMISKSLSISDKWASLDRVLGDRADFSRVLFVLMVTHADDHGRLPGDEGTIKRLVLPYTRKPLTAITHALNGLQTVGLVSWYEVDGQKCIEIEHFSDHQYLKGHETRPSQFPSKIDNGQVGATLGKSLVLREPNLTEPKRTNVACPKEPDPRVRIFIDWFHDEYAKRRNGAKYVVKGAKDGETVKRLLAVHDLERLKRHAVILLTTDEEWVESTDRGIGILSSKINWLEERLAAWEAKQHGRQAASA